MAIGHSLPFRIAAASRTLVFTKTSRETREPQKLTIVNTSSNNMTIEIEWYKFDTDSTYYLSKNYPIEVGDSQTADLSLVQLREGDKLYVTPTDTADVIVYLEEPVQT